MDCQESLDWMDKEVMMVCRVCRDLLVSPPLVHQVPRVTQDNLAWTDTLALRETLVYQDWMDYQDRRVIQAEQLQWDPREIREREV